MKKELKENRKYGRERLLSKSCLVSRHISFSVNSRRPGLDFFFLYIMKFINYDMLWLQTLK